MAKFLFPRTKSYIQLCVMSCVLCVEHECCQIISLCSSLNTKYSILDTKQSFFFFPLKEILNAISSKAGV